MASFLTGLVQPFFEDSVDRNLLPKATLWLKLGADPNIKLSKPLLSKAAMNGHVDMVSLLLAAGANVNAVDAQGDTALMYALRGIDIVTSRVKKDAPGGLEGRATAAAKAWVPMSADKKPAVADKTTTWVLDDGGNVGDTGMTVGERKLPPEALDVVKALLAGGANPNIASKGSLTYRQTPLMMAAIWGETPIIRALLRARGNVNATDSDGETVLMYAAAEGTVDVVKALIAAGAALDIQNSAGATALHIAAQYNHGPVISTLLGEGANAALKKNMGATALELAVAMQNGSAVKALLPTKPGAAAGPPSPARPKSVMPQAKPSSLS
jgi:hypothetical protein